MKSIPKLIKRFVGILLLSSFFIFIINLAILIIIATSQVPNASPWRMAQKAAESIKKNGQSYVMADSVLSELKSQNIWAIYIDNKTYSVIWKSDNLPNTIPLEYTASDIADLTRGYIDSYPTFTGESESGLIVLGYPKDRFWKHMWPSWDYKFIINLPKIFLIAFLANVCIIFIIYLFVNTRLLKSIKPIIDGIQALTIGQPITLKETGLLCEIFASINRASSVLQSQNYTLKKKETARANWIAGVSHDIRTPLSMVMGYASQLENSKILPKEERQKACVIVKQSEKIKKLINDLNLASKLEYNMQPLHIEKINIISCVRQVIVDFINLDICGKHKIEWLTDNYLNLCTVNADKDLIKRAVSNLIQNSINHNPEGCIIYVLIKKDDSKCYISISDNGIGATDEQIYKLNNSPHYMVCDENTSDQRHGLGLLIVKQIITAHGGNTNIGHSKYGGFENNICLPIYK